MPAIMEKFPTSRFALFMVVLTALSSSSASALSADCSAVIFGMANCLDYVSEGSNVTKPSDSCCTGIASVVKVNATCLCVALKESASLGVKVNMTRAVALPDVCSVEIPAGERCSGSSRAPTGIAGSTAVSPSQSPSISPSSSSSPPVKSPAASPPPAKSPASSQPSPAKSPAIPPSPPPRSSPDLESAPPSPAAPSPSPSDEQSDSSGASPFASSAVTFVALLLGVLFS